MKNTLLVLLFSTACAFGSTYRVSDLSNILIDGENKGRAEDVIANFPDHKTDLGNALLAELDARPLQNGTRIIAVCEKYGITVSQARRDAVAAAQQAEVARLAQLAADAKKRDDELSGKNNWLNDSIQ